MIGIVIPFHLKGNKENECYRRAFSFYSQTPHLIHLCGSEGELSRSFCEPFLSDNVKYFEVPQGEVCTSSSGSEALREKFNDSLKTLPDGLSWYCLAGADDIASPVFFKQLALLNNKRVIMAGVAMGNKLYLLDENKAWHAHSILLKYKIPLNLLAGINAFSPSAMKVSDYRPYQLKGCETGAELYFAKKGKVVGLDGDIVMFKGGNVLNGLDKILKAHKNLKVTPAEKAYLQKIIDLTNEQDVK